MNKKQLWKIIEETGLTDKAFELGKNHKRKRIRRSIEVVDLEINEKMFFQKWQMLQNIITKVMFVSYTTMEKSGKIKKLM